MRFLHKTEKCTFRMATTTVTIREETGRHTSVSAHIDVEIENYAQTPEPEGQWNSKEISRVYKILTPVENTRQASDELQKYIDFGPPYDPLTITWEFDGREFHTIGHMDGYSDSWQMRILCDDFTLFEDDPSV